MYVYICMDIMIAKTNKIYFKFQIIQIDFQINEKCLQSWINVTNAKYRPLFNYTVSKKLVSR